MRFRLVTLSVVFQVRDGCSPLFLACKKGNVEIVDYLVSVCGADFEQKGQYEVPDDHSVHLVTPLWCAAVAGKARVVECLVRHGADVNSGRTKDSIFFQLAFCKKKSLICLGEAHAN